MIKSLCDFLMSKQTMFFVKLDVGEYVPDNWGLFIDSPKQSLKCVLLHNTNVYAAVPIGHSTTLKEKYHSVKDVL